MGDKNNRKVEPLPTEPKVDPAYTIKMRSLAEGIDEVLNGPVRPKKVGFALLMFEFGHVDNGRVNYISNADRADMFAAVKEWVARMEGRYVEPEARNQ